MLRFARSATFAAFLSLALAGCGAAGASRSPHRSSGLAPTPTPTPSHSPSWAEPASAIPGECSDFVADASTIARVSRAPSGAAVDAARRQSGELLCSWDGSGSESLRLDLLRHSAVLAADPLGWWNPSGGSLPQTDASSVDCEVGASVCAVEAIVGDYWFSLSLNAEGAHERAVALSRAASAIVHRLRTLPVPDLWSPPHGSWPDRIDCDAVESAAGVGAALGISDLSVRDSTRQGDEFQLSDAVARLGGRSACTWSTPDAGGAISQVSADFVAGGGWQLRVAPDGEEVILRGADEARVSCLGGGRCAVVARIGVNLVTVGDFAVSAMDNTPSRQQVLDAATAVVAGVDDRYPRD